MLLVFLATLAGVTKSVIDVPSVQAQGLEWTAFTFESDAGEKTDAERAVITVPASHAKPSGPTIRLPLIRFKSKASTPGAPIIYLAGGPCN